MGSVSVTSFVGEGREGLVNHRDAAFMRLAFYKDHDRIRAALLAYATPGETYGYNQTKKEVWSYSFVRDATIIAVANALYLDAELPPPRADVRHVPDKDHPNDYVNVVEAPAHDPAVAAALTDAAALEVVEAVEAPLPKRSKKKKKKRVRA